ncbi:MAG TPA: cytochrome P450 [Steroidobacteraceae bacterium]|nr:cytochrome P450 [Steroidobacteraceae bacterium]
MNIDDFDLRTLPRSFYEEPYSSYAKLRSVSPVHRLPDGSFFLTRYADLEHVYRDTGTFSSDKKIEFKPKFGDSPLYEHHTTSLVFNDPPLHTRVRRIIAGALTPRAIADLEEGLITVVDQLLDRIESKGSADLIADFASAIPVEIIGNLLTIPHEEREPLRGWSLAILGALEPAPTAPMLLAGNQAVQEFLSYLEKLVADRRRSPGDPARDVLTRLLGQEHEVQLTEIELLQNCIFILNAGHETTTNLIGNGLQLLIEWPDQRRALLQEPELIKSAVEEFLRFESSNQLGNRRATIDTQLGGIRVPAGTLLNLCIGAANRDPEQFEDPDQLRISRKPNRHLAFGSGPHICVGVNLARLEGRVAISRFVERFPKYRASGVPIRGGRARFRGFLTIPIEVR